MATMRITGIATGLDTENLLSKIMAVERIPLNHLQQELDINDIKLTALNSIKSSAVTCQEKLNNLKDSNYLTTSTKEEIKDELADFVEQYNSLQNMISSYTQTPKSYKEYNSSGSILSHDSNIIQVGFNMRTSISGKFSEGDIQMLEDVGIEFNASNNTINFNEVEFGNAFDNHPDELKEIISKSMINLDDVINEKITPDITQSIGSISSQNINLTQNFSDLEARLQVQEDRLAQSFALLEEYQTKANGIMQFLQERFNV